jgi:hypothetical protein
MVINLETCKNYVRYIYIHVQTRNTSHTEDICTRIRYLGGVRIPC